MVWFHSLGTSRVYVTTVPIHSGLITTSCLVNWRLVESRDNHARGEESHMADPPPYPEAGDSKEAPDRGSTAGRSRWVVVLLWIIGIVLVLGFVVLHLTGTFGPGAH
jgi:hypothetical protein